MENGIRQGVFSSYYLLVDGKPVIQNQSYVKAKTGPIHSTGNYKNNKYDGEILIYYSNEQLKRREYYDEGIPIGEWDNYSPSGEERPKTIYDNGTFIEGWNEGNINIFVGIAEEFHRPLLVRSTFVINSIKKNNLYNGPSQLYYISGKGVKQFTEENFENGKRNGRNRQYYLKKFDENGNEILFSDLIYDQGSIKEFKFYFQNGKLIISGYQDFETEEVTLYDSQGDLVMKGEGRVIDNYPDDNHYWGINRRMGSRHIDISVRRGDAHYSGVIELTPDKMGKVKEKWIDNGPGFERSFYANGNLQSSKYYLGGELNGICSEYNFEGQLLRKTNYINGVMNGEYTEALVDNNGEIIGSISGEIEDGEMVGVWREINKLNEVLEFEPRKLMYNQIGIDEEEGEEITESFPMNMNIWQKIPVPMKRVVANNLARPQIDEGSLVSYRIGDNIIEISPFINYKEITPLTNDSGTIIGFVAESPDEKEFYDVFGEKRKHPYFRSEVDGEGDERYYNDKGQLHRTDGPAIEWANGYKEWYRNGKLHRKDGSAIERIDGDSTEMFWYRRGKLHRIDGPAIERANGTTTERLWYLNGKRHRTNGPAIEYFDGEKEWYQNGKRHRTDGPAIEWADGTKRWFLNGTRVTQEEVEG